MSEIRNCKLVSADDGVFSILGFIKLRLPGPYLWHCQDYEEETGRGSIFHAFLPDQDSQYDLGSVTVVDATEDSSEPDIALINEDTVSEIDGYLLQETKSQLDAQGRELTHWLSSQLNEVGGLKCLVTAYSERDSGVERQVIAARLSFNGRKVVVIGVFDTEREDGIAKVVFGVMKGISFGS